MRLLLAFAFILSVPQEQVVYVHNHGKADSYGYAKTITCADVQGCELPSGLIMFSDSGSCPAGYTDIGTGKKFVFTTDVKTTVTLTGCKKN